MVLHPGGCGRVSYRRHLNKQKLHTIKTRQDTHVLTGLFGLPTWSISSSRGEAWPVFNTDPRRLIGAKETFHPDAPGYLRIGLVASTVVLGTTSWVGVE